MAENTTNKDFTKFHSLPVEEWESTIGGKDYEKYLEKAEKRQEIEKLSLYTRCIGGNVGIVHQKT